MENEDEEQITRDDIRRSALNRVSINEIEDHYSSAAKAKSNQKAHVPDWAVPLVAGLGSFLMLAIIAFGGFLIYGILFSR